MMLPFASKDRSSFVSEAMSLLETRQDVRAPHFVTTHWSVVLTAGANDSPQCADALSRLCRAYWYPLYAYVRRQGHEAPDAQDLTQEFFARLLARNDLCHAGPEKGRFRSFLLIRLKHFLINEWEKARTQKRGGGQTLVPLDDLLAEQRYGDEPRHQWTAERLYERRWAITLLEGVFARLREEWTEAGKADQFEALKALLASENLSETYAQLGARLGLSEGAVKVAVHRLRRRYRELVRDEIAQTVATPGEVEDELRHLLTALSN
jgi:RNA polymerase sigma-70 factor (ECF subfamily)